LCSRFCIGFHGEELAPDALVKTISLDVLAAIQKTRHPGWQSEKDREPRRGEDPPHFDFAHTTRIAMGANWRRASPEQARPARSGIQDTSRAHVFRVLVNYRDQVIEFKPLRAQPGDAQVTVRSEVRQSGAQAVSIDYEMERTPSGWKVYDVKISGASLAATYRDTFAEEIRNRGIEGLIDSLSNKNRQNDARPAPVNT